MKNLNPLFLGELRKLSPAIYKYLGSYRIGKTCLVEFFSEKSFFQAHARHMPEADIDSLLQS